MNLFYKNAVRSLTTLACMSFAIISNAQIVAWDFTAAAGNEATIAATSLNANLSATSVTRGAGLNGSALAGAYSSTDYTANGTATDAVNNNDYKQFTIQAQSGFKVSLSTLDVIFRRSSTGPNAFQWKYSLNGFATAGIDIGSAIPYTNTATNGIAQTQISLTGISALQNVVSPAVITIRLYGWGATATTGTFGLGRLTGNDLAIGGTVAVNSTPILTNGALGGFGNVCINTTAGPNSFTLTGNNLDGSAVTVGPLSGFTFSETSGGSYTPTVSPSYVAPNLSATIYVKFTPIAVQSYSGNIPVSGGGASTINVAAAGSGVNTAPTVSTGAAGSILYNSASLPGTITDFGCSGLSGYGVEYSTLNGFANGSGTAVPSSNLVGNNFSSTVTGLQANTVYYFHAYATNGAGTGYGAQSSFTTAQLNAPVATAATSVGNTSFIANWNSVADATAYRLDVATTSTFYAASTTPVAEWNFPSNPDDNVIDGGIGPNLTRTINAIGATGTITYAPVSGSTTSAATGPGWDNGNGNDYWEINIVTAGYYNLKVSSAQRSSNTGPRDFKVQYKIGAGGTYTDVPGATSTVANDWTTGVITSISLPAVCENKISVFLRWIMTSNTSANGGTVAAAGTSAIDNVSIIGNAGTFVSGYNNLSVSGTSQLVNSNLTANTTYFYRVRATGGLSTSANSNVISLTTTCTAPAIGACPFDIEQCDNGIVSWTDPTATGDPAVTVSCSPASGSTFTIGTTVVTCTATNGCGSPSTCTFNVTINESPVIGSCPVDITSCDETVFFTDPTASGTSPVVTCTPPSGSAFPSGVTIVTCDATNSCGSSSCSFNITVNDESGDPTGATSNAAYGQICLGGNVTLTVSGGSLGTGASWVWYEGGCGTGGSIGTGTSVTVTPGNSGNHIYYVRAEGVCGNSNCATVSVFVIVAPPAGTVHYTANISDGCVAAPAATFSVNAVSGASFYRWTSAQSGVRFNGNPSPFETTVPNVSVTFVSLPPGGSSGWSICSAAGNACGNSNTICTWVRATVSMPAPVSGSVVGCPGSSGNNYSVAAVTGAVSYQWSGTNGITISNNGSQNVQVTFPGGFITGVLSVHAQTSCGYNGPDRNLTISATPAMPGIISGPSYPCPSGSASYSIPAVAGATSYTWTTSVVGAIVIGTSTSCSIQFPGSIPGGSTVSVVANSSCPTTSGVRSKGIGSGIPNVPASISGPASGQCGQTGVSYSIAPVALATSYTWTTSCGTIVGPGNLSAISVDWPAAFTTCTLSVSAINSCGTGGARTLVVSSVPATPPAISGSNTPCAGNVENYTTTGSVGATSYNWTVPAGSTIIGPANGTSIFILWGSTSGNITVVASNSCGNSGVRTLPVTISCRMSQVVESGSFDLNVYPNPAVGKTTIEMICSNSEKVSIEVYDLEGRKLIEKNVDAVEGLNQVDLDLNNLKQGIYTIKAGSSANTKLVKLIVQ